MVRFNQPADPRQTPPRRPLRRYLLIGLGIAALALLAVVVCGALWTARLMARVQEVTHQAQARYTDLNKQYPFEPPVAGREAVADRYGAMLRAREAARLRISPKAAALFRKQLDQGSLSELDLLTAASSALLPTAEAVLKDHAAALGEAGMSLEEYRWLLGSAVHAALAQSGRYEAGAGYRAVLGELERLTRADKDPANDVIAEKAIQTLAERYQQMMPPESSVIDQLASPDPILYALDLFVVASPWEKVQSTVSPSGLKLK